MKLKAFTLVEVVIVVTLLAISIGVVLSWTMDALDQAKLQTTTESVMGNIRRQQASARSTRSDVPHGIFFETNQYTLFSGADYATSDTSTRQLYSLPTQITFSNISLNGGGNELLFNRASGETDQDGSITLSHEDISENNIITISPIGLVTW